MYPLRAITLLGSTLCALLFSAVAYSQASYVQGGNAFGTTGTLGLTDNNNLNIITNNSTRLTVTNSGNVGIGTTSPSDLLHVYKNVNANVSLKFENPNGGNATAMYLLTTDGTHNVYFGQDGAGVSTPRANQGYIYSDTDPGVGLWAGSANGLIRFYTGGSSAGNERMRIDNTGKVGIGVSSPDARLSILADFSGSPAAGTAGEHMTFAFPSGRSSCTAVASSGACSLWFGWRADIEDPLLNGTAALAIFNTGTADSAYFNVRGQPSGMSTGTCVSNHTCPTGIGMELNAGLSAMMTQYTIDECYANPSTTCQHNSLWTGYGMQIYDYTYASTSGSPLLIQNIAGGNNALAKFYNTGSGSGSGGSAYIEFLAGCSGYLLNGTTSNAACGGGPPGAENESGLRFLDRAGNKVWLWRKNGDNTLEAIDYGQSTAVFQLRPYNAGSGAGMSVRVVPTSTNPVCSATGDIGKLWFDNTTSSTVEKHCKSVTGTVQWITI